jgi:hypothetical protein
VRPAALLLPAIVLLAAACSTPTGATAPAQTAGPSVDVAPSAAPSESPTAIASPSDRPSKAPGATPAPTMTPDEAALVGTLRADAATDCAPRRTDLPEGAQYGIECHPADPLVERIGIYWFASRREAATAYLARMATYGVGPNAGDCFEDVPGDRPWMPGDNEGSVDDPGVFTWEGHVLSPSRDGCFRDEDGAANVRATCDQAYVGVLGTGTDLSDLHEWIWRYPDGYEVGTPDLPGVCIGEALVVPGSPEAP